MRVLIMFCSLCFCCFLGMNEVSFLLYPVFRSFLEVEGGCMGTVKTKGNSSQITLETVRGDRIAIF